MPVTQLCFYLLGVIEVEGQRYSGVLIYDRQLLPNFQIIVSLSNLIVRNEQKPFKCSLGYELGWYVTKVQRPL